MLDFLNTVFTTIKIGSFYGGEHREQKCADSRLSLTKWWCSINRVWTILSRRRVKLLQILVEIFKFFIDLLSLLPKGLLMNSKTRSKMLNCLLQFDFQLLKIFILCLSQINFHASWIGNAIFCCVMQQHHQIIVRDVYNDLRNKSVFA